MTSFNPPITLPPYEPESSPLGDRVLGVPPGDTFAWTSYSSDIAAAVEQARLNPRVKLIHIDLGDGHRWWNTRLFLVAALAAQYSHIAALVFKANCVADNQPGCFVGTATPQATRQALAATAADLEAAYARGQAVAAGIQLPAPAGPPAAAAVVPAFGAGPGSLNAVIAGFVGSLPQPEGKNGIEVTSSLLSQWLATGLVADSLPAPSGPPGVPVAPAHLGSILARSEPFVALTTAGRLIQMVDRCALASRLAVEALAQQN